MCRYLRMYIIWNNWVNYWSILLWRLSLCSSSRERGVSKINVYGYNIQGFFMYKNKLYKQIDGVTLGSPLGPILADFFLGYLEKICCQLKIKSLMCYLNCMCVTLTMFTRMLYLITMSLVHNFYKCLILCTKIFSLL